MADDPLTTTPTIARARVLIWLSRAAGKALRNDAQVLSYNGEVSIHILLILITVLAPRIIPDGGVMRTSLCQVPPFEGTPALVSLALDLLWKGGTIPTHGGYYT